MNDNEELTAVFAEVGKKYGFDTVKAEFISCRDFKIRWQMSYRWADFKVSDYMRNAPHDAVVSLANTIFGKMVSGEDSVYEKIMTDYVSSPKFVEMYQPLYLRRSRNLTHSPLGKNRDLGEAYERLISLGLVERDPAMCLTWTKEPIPTGRAARCSVLMKVVAVSSLLDDPDIPEECLDYALYTELCRVSIGFDPNGDKNRLMMPKLADRYGKERMKEASDGLKAAQMYV
ncbi:MAG: hypothetical protein VZQ28_05275 [Methanomethylophilus sp.]|nr:hypothetical protein [Methanomethylophilus sp.]